MFWYVFHLESSMLIDPSTQKKYANTNERSAKM